MSLPITFLAALSLVAGQVDWKLSDQPIQVTGTPNGADAGILGRVVGVTRFKNGSLVVADRQSLSLHRFDTSGRSVGMIGRAGAGPGEFRTIQSMRRCAGDSLFVYDPSLLRISVFSPEGNFSRTIPLADAAGGGPPPYEFYCNENGVLALLHRSLAPPAGVGPRRPNVAVTIIQPNDRLVSVGTFPASERYFNGSEDFARPLGKQTSLAVGSTTLYIGTGDHVDARDSVRIVGYSFQGNERIVIRDRFATVPLSARRLSAYIEQQASRRAGREEETRGFYRSLEYPPTFPAYRNVLVDPTEHIWVEESPVPGDAISRWRVYSPKGLLHAAVRMPRSFQLMEIGSDYAVGVWRDEMDIETVRVYRLIKTDS